MTLEYVLIDGLNDTPELAEELGVLLRDMNCLVNLIPLNPVPGTGFRRNRSASPTSPPSCAPVVSGSR